MSIVTEKLSYVYNPGSPFSAAAVTDVDLAIEDGDFFGIIGHTGSGKSTLVQHFNVLLKPTSGLVLIDGVNPADKGVLLKRLRSTVGMVFQYPEYQLFAETVFDDVAFGIKNFLVKRTRKEKKLYEDFLPPAPDEVTEMVRGAITLVGLDYDKVKNKSPFDLSGGQKRRVAIAGVIAARPKTLILDEPTAGLDPQGKREIMSLVHELQASCSPTIIMISHDMNEVARNCSRLAVIKKGRVAAVGTPAAIFGAPAFLEENRMELPDAVMLSERLAPFGLRFTPRLFTEKETAELLLERLRDRVSAGSGTQSQTPPAGAEEGGV